MSIKNFKISFLFFLFTTALIYTITGFPAQSRAALILEGRLFEHGEKVAVGETATMTMRIFNDEFGGTLLYEESQEIRSKSDFSSFTFEKGKVNIKKRFSGTPAETLWIETEYEGQIMTPRLNLGELGSQNDLVSENSTIREAHLRTGGTATLVIDNNGITLGGLLDMGSNSIKLGGDSRNEWLTNQVTALNNRIAALEDLLQHFSRIGDEITISHANLNIVNGSGSTDGLVDGLGNLIVGYNEPRGTGNDRSGSHNIVVGTEHNFLSYGGLVAGKYNTIKSGCACVSGGYNNTASGWNSSVSGGYQNKANGISSSVSGGYQNTASGNYASVSGGNKNMASGSITSVSGGKNNTASNDYASISGGEDNTASGEKSSVSGGRYNLASGEWSSISAGGSDDANEYNEASGEYACVSGGHRNKASGYISSVSGGDWNWAKGNYSSVSGGYQNWAQSPCSSVSGGFHNLANGQYSSASGGNCNQANGKYSSVSGGSINEANSEKSSVSGGYENLATGEYSSISGGAGNEANGVNSSVSGGVVNKATGSCASISGGESNIASGYKSSVSGGKDKVANTDYEWCAGSCSP